MRTASHACTWCCLLLALLSPGLGRAEVQTIQMRDDYSDYAIHPETGDLVALTETGEALLFRADDLKGDKPEPASKLRVGSSPCSVFYKQFGDKKIFTVVCSQDSHMFLINAGDFTLLKKVELSASGVSSVTGSLNPEDPFLYYNYGGGHDSVAGAVNLRTLQSVGVAFDHSMDCAISASGQTAYRRGPWSPSGFESLQRTSGPGDPRPAFVRLFYDHDSTDTYLPDPFDRFTTAGVKVYTRSLEKHQATLDFKPYCFFTKKPLIVGLMEGNLRDRFRGRDASASSVILRVASYNTFSSIGDKVEFKVDTAKGDGRLPRGVESDADFKVVAKRLRVFADEPRDRVILAYRDHVSLVPLADFNLPDEPFLLASLAGAERIFAGRDNQLELKLLDKRAEFEIEDKPEGLEADGSKLTWKPALDQVAPAKLVVTLKAKDIQRSLTFDLPVEFPSVALPFSPADLLVTKDNQRAAIWEGTLPNLYGQFAPTDGRATPAPSSFRIALIELESGKVLAERKLAESLRAGACSTDHLALFAGPGANKCEVLRWDNLEKEKTIVADAQIQQVHFVGKQLVLQTAEGFELFDPTFKRTLKVQGGPPRDDPFTRPRRLSMQPSANGIFGNGLLADGVYYDAELKPALLVEPKNLPVLAGADPNWRLPQATPEQPERPENNLPPGFDPTGRGVGRQRIDTRRLGSGQTQVSLELRNEVRDVPGATHTSRAFLEISLLASGDVDARQVLVQREEAAIFGAGGEGQRSLQPLLRTSDVEALAIYGDLLFRWKPPAGEEKSDAVEPLTWEWKQSAMALSGTGKMVLQHQARGGKGPLKYSLESAHDALSVDEKTGEVTIDEAALLGEAAKKVEQQIVTSAPLGTLLLDTFRASAPGMVTRATAILGRKPKGPPVAIPIRVEVSDSAGDSATLQYYVLAEVSSSELQARLKQLDDERTKQIEEQQKKLAERPMPMPVRRGAVEERNPDDPAALRRRIDSLEERLDLITRQLNEVLKKLER